MSVKDRLKRLGVHRSYRRTRRLAGNLVRSPRRLLGRSRSRLRRLLRAAAIAALSVTYRLRNLITRGGLSLDRQRSDRRLIATGSWGFPIYSQTFVYQELSQLILGGFDLRLIYGRLEPRDRLASRFQILWPRRRRLVTDRRTHAADLEHFRRRMPDRVAELAARLARASGLSRREVLDHPDVMRAFSFARLAAAYRPHYIHSYFFYEGTLCAFIASWLLDVPRGVSCYADHLLDDYPLKVAGLHLETCDLVIATSERIRRELLAVAPAVPGIAERIIVKPNAIDVRHFPPVARRDPGVAEPFRLLCVNRIEPKKGLRYAVEALRRLRRRGIEVELHILGEADPGSAASEACARELAALVERWGLRGAVHLEGASGEAEVRRRLELAHLFVAPYVETPEGDKDGIPTALLEAMSSGLAPVATGAGSIAEVIDDGIDGVLVPQRDPVALAAAIERLLADPERRRRLGEQATAKVASRFDVEVCEPRFHQRLTEVISGPAG